MAQGTPELLEALEKIDPRQPYGTELFDALARLTVSVAVEAVCLRINYIEDDSSFCVVGGYNDVEVYMTQRPKTEAYPGQWHCPGSVMRPDETFGDVLKRLAEKEFEGELSSARFVANLNPSPVGPEDRGTFLSIVYLCAFEGKGKGEWFSVKSLPPETNWGHRERIIPCVLGAFLADNPEANSNVIIAITGRG